ncbi:MAG: prepilin-type N-terminal cleavage/methylation domain-containing protein [bacterium]
MVRNLKNQQGFTLIELMIVVAIIGILSAIAIPNFMTFRLKAKTSEAKANLGSIRTCEEAYKAEQETYYGTIAQYPTSVPGATSVAWTSTATAFSAIGFAPSGKVYYSYEVTAADTSAFTAKAYGNLDDTAPNSTYSITNDGDITRESAAEIF